MMNKRIELPKVVIPTDIQQVMLDEPSIQWGGSYEEVEKSPIGSLREFIRLTDASGAEIEDFSYKWGIMAFDPAPNYIYVNDGIEARQIQPIRFWHIFARIMRGMIKVRMALSNNTQPNLSDWGAIFCPENPESFRWPIRDRKVAVEIGFQQYLLAEEATSLLRTANIHPSIQWNETETPQLLLWGTKESGTYIEDVAPELSTIPPPPNSLRAYLTNLRSGTHLNQEYQQSKPSTSLFKSLVLQLSAALTTPDGLEICDVCHNPFPVEGRKPHEGRRKFCGDECALEAHREKMKMYQRNRRKTISNK